jgi:hypothetical protein
MFTLAQAAREARLLMKYGGIALGVLLALFVLFRLGVFLKDTFFPTPIAPPDERFGELPKLNFKVEEDFKPVYRIETDTGFLPAFSDRAYVFKFHEYETNILTVQRTREAMKRLGFTENEQKIDELVYQWTHKEYPNKLITFNMFTKTFDIKYPFYTDNDVLEAKHLGTGTEAVSTVQSFLQGLGEDITDIDFNNSIINYYRLDNGKLSKIADKKDAQIIQVSLVQKSIEDLGILYNYYNDSDMSFYIGSGKNSAHIVEAFYKHRRINIQDNATYGIITAEQAFQDLQNGNALILKKGSTSQVDILKVYLSYFMNNVDDDYLTPVVVFEGRDFRAYVEAVGKPLPPEEKESP